MVNLRKTVALYEASILRIPRYQSRSHSDPTGMLLDWFPQLSTTNTGTLGGSLGGRPTVDESPAEVGVNGYSRVCVGR